MKSRGYDIGGMWVTGRENMEDSQKGVDRGSNSVGNNLFLGWADT